MRRKPIHRLPALLVTAFVAFGCDGTPVQGPESAPTANKGRGNGGGSGSGGTGTFDLDLTGGLQGTSLGITLLDDRKQRVWAPFDNATWNAALTHAAADLERTDPAASDVCSFVPSWDEVDDATKQELVSWLLAGNVFGSMSVQKVDGRGNITAGPDGEWMSLGNDPDTRGQEDHRAFVDDGGSGSDWDDPSATRVFRFTGGWFRLLADGGGLKCENQGDVIVATLAPAN